MEDTAKASEQEHVKNQELPKSSTKATKKSEGGTTSDEQTRDSSAGSRKDGSRKTRSAQSTASKRNHQGLRIVNQSGRGLTTVPPTLFTTKEVGELNLSRNNLRTIPAEIKRFEQLSLLDLTKNGLRCLNPNDFGGLPRELENLKNLEELRMSECNLMFVPPVVWKLSSLKILDISRNKIQMVFPEVGQLSKLEKLNLQQTSITSLPPELALCQKLKELYLWGNSIDSLPDTLKAMPNLKVLALNCRSFAASVDEYMERLLKNGQIQSEHVPAVYWELPALQVADLECCKLNCIPDAALPNVKEMFLARNFFQTFPLALLEMSVLTVLDISDNTITELPESLGEMSQLESLRIARNSITAIPDSVGDLLQLSELQLDHNKITSLPSSIGKLKQLKSLMLAHNLVSSLPESLCQLQQLETLDLSDNLLRQVPLNLHRLSALRGAHTYDKLHRVGLWLHGNSIAQPPEEIWKTDNPEKIFEYLKRLAIMRTENLRPLKVLVLGSYQCGKTSLVRSITAGRSCMTDEITDASKVQEQFSFKTENKVQFTFYEMAGHERYEVIRPLFLDRSALMLLVYDLDALDSQMIDFESAVGRWLELLWLYCPGAGVFLVPTKADMVEDNEQLVEHVYEEASRRLDELHVRCDMQLTAIDQLLQTASGDEAKQIKHQRQRLMEIYEEPVRLAPMTGACSTTEMRQGLQPLLMQMEALAVDKTWFPHAQRYVPSSWHALLKLLKASKKICLTQKEVNGISDSLHALSDGELDEFLEHQHKCGNLIQLQDWHGPSGGVVIPKPRCLVKVLRGVFRHDMEEYMDFNESRVFAARGNYDEMYFEEARRLFLEQGQASRPMLHCLWFELKLKTDGVQELLGIMSSLGLAYKVPEPEVPEGTNLITPLLVFPSNVICTSPDDLEQHWPDPVPDDWTKLQRHWHVTSTFPIQVLHSLSVTLQEHLEKRLDWDRGILGWLANGAGQVLVSLQPRCAQQTGTWPDAFCTCILSVWMIGPDAEALIEPFEAANIRVRRKLTATVGCTWFESSS